MSSPTVIIGSGFAAYQLVKSIRRIDSEQAIIVITADSGDDYVKPELSHVFSKQMAAIDLVKQSGEVFAVEQGITLINHSYVESINRDEQTVSCKGIDIEYGHLILATGAESFIPPVSGDGADDIITLNSLLEYQVSQEKLAKAKSVLVIGAGLIGTEIAMDLVSTNRKVILSDRADSLLPSLLPEFVSAQLYQTMRRQGITLQLANEISQLTRTTDGLIASFKDGQKVTADCVVCAAGLKPNIGLATQAGLDTNRGIVVDRQLRTNDPYIYALGDCAEIDGKHLAFLQPILLSANALAKTITDTVTDVLFPAMLVKIKTPVLPIQLSGNTTDPNANWKLDVSAAGMTAKAYDNNDQLIGFVVTNAHVPQAFPLLRQLPKAV